MPRASTELEINRPPEQVFALLHDYDRRLAWDPLLQQADIIDGSLAAAKGVRTRCVGTWRSGGIGMETEYISFDPGRVAAVSMCRPAPFFARFVATIDHRPLPEGRSVVRYIYSFQARPRALRWLLEPIMNAVLLRETRRRLAALKAYLENKDSVPTVLPAPPPPRPIHPHSPQSGKAP